MPDDLQNIPPPTPGPAPTEPTIVTIPDKFYGAALKAKVEEKLKPAAAPSPPPEVPPAGKRAAWALPAVIGLVLVAGIAGGFMYFNRDLLFGKPSPAAPLPTPEPPKPPPLPPPPASPTNLSATATAPTVVNLTWTDTSDNETGFRLERREATASYVPLTTLSLNATAFLDVSAQPGRDYAYRLIAINTGGESAASNEATATTPAAPPPPPEAPKLPPAGLDSDSDGLTDLEEPLYGTNPKDPDADKDSFLDGNEVFHLYNPAGKQGVTLLQSGLVKVFESPVGWRMLVPTTWQVKLEDDGMKGAVITGHGETFTLGVEDRSQNQSLLDWHLAQHPGVLSSQVATIRTKSGYEGIEGADQLTVYFAWGSKVFVFRYNLDDQPFVNFRTTYEMMKNSMSLTATPNVPAAQPALSVPSATATSTFAPVTPLETVTPTTTLP